VIDTLREAPHHNTLTCYTDYGCRRPECVTRYLDWERDRLARQANGTWDNLIDATPVRDHIQQLKKAGFPPYRTAKAAGVPLQSVLDFLGTNRPRRHRTSPATAAKLLAVTAEDTAPRLVPALGTHRRLQALVAAGWPMHTLDRRLGFKTERMRKILTKDTVTSGTRALITATYDELHNRRPDRHGVPKHCARWAREYGRARRWPTPAYWDAFPGALDDPHFVPEYGRTRLEIHAEDGQWAMTGGIDRELVAERLGVDRSYLDKALAAYVAGEVA